MKISPGVKGHEKYAIFYACALHVHREENKRKLKSDLEFQDNTKKLLTDFLEKFEYTNDEIEKYFDV